MKKKHRDRETLTVFKREREDGERERKKGRRFEIESEKRQIEKNNDRDIQIDR